MDFKKGGDIIEQIRCNCHDRAKIVAERDEQGNVYVQCRGCKEKIKIEPIKESREDEKDNDTL